ncbi:MAG TPA: hypothetical protein VMF67_19365 [Rhizomicrobium sp.]|nr:hypothetical protein [Rhizomicrobium sp.]
MFEITVMTTDHAFVGDLNSAGIEGVRAQYRPTMAYDDARGVVEIVVTAAAVEGLKLAGHWIADRFRKAPADQMVINNQNITNSDNVVTTINIYIDAQGKNE